MSISGATKRCTSCGVSIPIGASHCLNCSKPQVSALPDATARKVIWIARQLDALVKAAAEDKITLARIADDLGELRKGVDALKRDALAKGYPPIDQPAPRASLH